MDELEIEHNFDAIYMAISHGHIPAARGAFEEIIRIAVNEKLDKAVRIVEKSGAFNLINEIKELKFE